MRPAKDVSPLLFEAPPDHGLLITLEHSDDTSTLLLTFVPDLSLKSIHPNAHGPAGPLQNLLVSLPECSSGSSGQSNRNDKIPTSAPRVPASLGDVHALRGGGSGATVFSGTIPYYGMGSVVMKHGGPKETAEHVALATIENELRIRAEHNANNISSNDNNNDDGVAEPRAAAEFFRTRIPNFKFIYVSPWHCRDRGAELWSTLRNVFTAYRTAKLLWGEHVESNTVDATSHMVLAGKKTERLVRVYGGCSSGRGNNNANANSVSNGDACAKGGDDDEGGDDGPIVKVSNGNVDFVLGPDAELVSPLTASTPAIIRCGKKSGGYETLLSLSHHLRHIQKERMWKLTQGQSTIGGLSPRTASSLLVSGDLNADGGRLLSLLADEFIEAIRNLQALTLPNEKSAIDDVKQELELFETALADEGRTANARTATDITKKTDMFVGFAVRKNFHPIDGRFLRIRKAGERFRACFDFGMSAEEVGAEKEKNAGVEGKQYILKEKEKIPAFFLGKLLAKGARIQDVFDGPLIQGSRTALDIVLNEGNRSWLSLIRRAVSVEGDSARTCLWNGGLADAGLHNLFLDDERLWLFDLGEPAIQPVPAFLTKYLMSFFHVLGMEDVDEEDAEAVQGVWVRRFTVKGNNADEQWLQLTSDTANVLPKVYEAFEFNLEKMVDSLFGGEEAVRDLLIRYVVLQILSDAAFCIDRWTSKGGGSEGIGNHHHRLEKWLWRALWDLWVASDVASRMITTW